MHCHFAFVYIYTHICMYVCMSVTVNSRHLDCTIATDTDSAKSNQNLFFSPVVFVYPQYILSSHSTPRSVLIAFVCPLFRTVDMLDEITSFKLHRSFHLAQGTFSHSPGFWWSTYVPHSSFWCRIQLPCYQLYHQSADHKSSSRSQMRCPSLVTTKPQPRGSTVCTLCSWLISLTP